MKRSEQEGLSAPLLKRLKFDEAKISDAIDGIHSLIKLERSCGQDGIFTGLDDNLEHTE